MAHLLQGLNTAGLPLALLLVFPAAAAPGFSHRVHLAQKLTCVACHSSVPSSAKASDNNLPGKQICTSCHAAGGKARPLEPAIKQPRKLTVTKFNHQLHARLGNIAPLIARAIDAKTYLSPAGDLRTHLNTTNACAACHRGLEHSNEVSMAAFPRMADCLVCHSQIDPPFSCLKCHDDGPNLKPASHTPDYLDTHNRKGAIKDRESCAVCHGRQFTCLGCH